MGRMDGPQLRHFNYNWPRKGCPYNWPSMVPVEKPHRYLYEPKEREEEDPNWYIIDHATGSTGQVQRSFGRKTVVGFVPGSGVNDGDEVYSIEVRVTKPGRKSHHQINDTVIWSRPVKLCTPEEQDAFDL